MVLNCNPFIDKNHNNTLHAGSCYVRRRRQCPAVKTVRAVVVTKAVIMALTRLERAQAWILSACTGVLFALFRLLSPRRSRGFTKLIPVTNPLLMMSAMQLAQRIRRREVRRLPGTGLNVVIYFTRETTFPDCFQLYSSGAVGLNGAANDKKARVSYLH